MEPCRLHITGASGAGTTTLGRALANEWSVPHADVDDYFWEPTSPPYTAKRDPDQRLQLMERLFMARCAWVLSGSLMGWGDPVAEHFDAVVFLSVDHDVRMERLNARERVRYGTSINVGGAREIGHRDFMDWARGYEDPQFDGRNRARHERWLGALTCPVLRLDGSLPTDDLVTAVIQATPTSAPSIAPRG